MLEWLTEDRPHAVLDSYSGLVRPPMPAVMYAVQIREPFLAEWLWLGMYGTTHDAEEAYLDESVEQAKARIATHRQEEKGNKVKVWRRTRLREGFKWEEVP